MKKMKNKTKDKITIISFMVFMFLVLFLFVYLFVAVINLFAEPTTQKKLTEEEQRIEQSFQRVVAYCSMKNDYLGEE